MLERLSNSLAIQLPHYSSSAQVTISRSADDFVVRVFERSRWRKQSHQQENLQTLHELQLVIGEDRLQRICARPEIAIQWNEHLVVTKEVIQKLWAGMLDIRKDDLDFAHGKNIQGTSVKRIEKMYQALLPLTTFNENAAVWVSKVDLYDKAATSGKGLQGLREKAWTLHTATKSAIKGDAVTSYEQVELLSSRLIDREPAIGSVAWYDTGYYVVDKIFARGGAYITLWRHLSDSSRCLLVCRGTAMRYSASQSYTSGLNDMTYEIGFGGIKATWPELHRYLLQNRTKTIDLIGKSLGGAHAQYLTSLIVSLTDIQVKNVKTYCSVGVPQNVQTIYEKAIRDKHLSEPNFEIFRNGGDLEKKEMDLIPSVGGPHLHSLQRRKTYVYYAIPKGQKVAKIDERLTLSLQLLQSFAKAHVRQTSLIAYELELRRNIEQEIALGTHLEPIRLKLASMFNLVTFGRFNQDTFEAFHARELGTQIQLTK